MFYHHLMNLPEDSLAYQIAHLQDSLAFPGLIAECQSLFEIYGFMGDPKLIPKQQWKTFYKKVIKEKNKDDILSKMKEYKKLDINEARKEKFETTKYLKEMTLADAKMKFALRCKMTRTIQMNFKGDPRYRENKWKCVGCGEIDSQEHVISCSAYAHLRTDKDLKKDIDIIKYFKQVIAIREDISVGH